MVVQLVYIDVRLKKNNLRLEMKVQINKVDDIIWNSLSNFEDSETSFIS